MDQIEALTLVTRLELPSSRIQDDVVFFDQAAGKYYATGEVGAAIWEFLEQPRRVQEILEHLIGLYEIDSETCEKETLAFLGQLANAGLIGLSAR